MCGRDRDFVTHSPVCCGEGASILTLAGRFPVVPNRSVGVVVAELPGRSRLCTGRRHQAGGQSLVEFAISLPVLCLLLAVAYVGWQAVHTVIALNGAARAGAVTAANDVRKGLSTAQETTDVTSAVNAEQGSGSFTSVTYGTSCSASCVSLRHALPGTRTSVAMEVVTVQSKVVSGVPLLSGFTVTAQAGVAP